MNLGGRDYSFAQILIGLVILIACAALFHVALVVFGIAIPSWVMTVFWICVAAFVIIAAIRLVSSM